MQFNSIEYLLFLPIVAIGFCWTPARLRWGWLLAASYLFYMRWDPRYLVLIWISTGVDFWVARQLTRAATPSARRAWLATSLSVNLGLLFTFKYWSFAHQSLAQAAAWIGVDWPVGSLDVLLPVGISFYTFQTLSYTLDVYRGVLVPERHLGRFALYVAFFPQLVAGPIERAGHLLPQLRSARTPDLARVRSDAELILWGLFKKVVIADRLAIYVDLVYADPAAHTSGSLLLATYLFAYQIYCDFSAYTDIARGSARILGIDLIENFRVPYLARDLADFWRRWHISLSTWLRDYLYIPLGGNRRRAARLYANLILTMLLGGLWHGAGYTFLLWGALHGVGLALGRATRPARTRLLNGLGLAPSVRSAVGIVVTFHLVCIGWVLFRAPSVSDAWILATKLAGPWEAPLLDASVLTHAALGLVVLWAVDLRQALVGDVRARLESAPPLLRAACIYGLLLALALLGVESGSQFIYFQF